jgi:cation:H+ antiporter
MLEIIEILLGLVLAGIGGEIFLKGAVGFSLTLRISPAIVGLTIAAFATSSPELSVAILSALDGTPELSLGDAVGSNIVNIALIMGIACIISPTTVGLSGTKRDIPFAFIAPILLALIGYDGEISRIDGLILLGTFGVWLWLVIEEGRTLRAMKLDSGLKSSKGNKNIVQLIAGLCLLIAAGKFIVTGGTGIGERLGIEPFLIGATLVAIGTSIPELATTILSKIRGHSDIGLGTVLGSNIFNGLFVVALAALIHPIQVTVVPILIGLAFGILSVIAILPTKKKILGRKRGALLLCVYLTYLLTCYATKGSF